MQVGRGLLADTPGFNVPSLTNLTISNLQACFPEIERRLDTHRYRDEEVYGACGKYACKMALDVHD